MSDAPKSAVELALERLRKKDADAGIPENTPLTQEQREAIAEVRRIYEARVAERRLRYESDIFGIYDPRALEAQHEQLRRELAVFEAERDEKIKEIRG